MKIAVASDDGKAISRHFGRAPYYLVFTIDEDKIVEVEQREKTDHQQFAHEHHDHHAHEHELGHGFGTHSAEHHIQMVEPIRDCDAVIVRGMGRGAYHAMQQANIRPILTEIEEAEDAVHAFIDGTLVDHPELLH